MQRYVRSVLAWMVVLATLNLAPRAARSDDLKPSIHIPKMRHDFGEVFEREKYEYDFEVRNRGKADLLIKNVKPG